MSEGHNRRRHRRSMLVLTMVLALSGFASQAHAFDAASTARALRLSSTITGGSMPTSDPIFMQMVSKIAGGDVKGAAMLATKSKYGVNYLMKRMAFQMQSPSLDETIVTDNDATAFVIAHFAGTATTSPSLSTLWSENQTYVVNIPISSVMTPTHINDVASNSGFKVSPASIDWSTQITTGGPQQARTLASVTTTSRTYTAIPAKHIGGYVTASTQIAYASDTSFASYGAYAGTNLRMIEGIWEVSQGVSLADAEDTTYAASLMGQSEATPRFVPENNSNFYVGQGQPACISCHGGGLSAAAHGYATVADVFDYTAGAGLIYNDPTTATTGQKKSLGSTPLLRASTLACNLTKTPNVACNPDSPGVDPNQGWDLSSWKQTGLLDRMGWTGPITGQGLNALGVAIGQASGTYEYLTERVVQEICPTGAFTGADIKNIASAVNPYAIVPGTDDFATIVTLVATNATCE